METLAYFLYPVGAIVICLALISPVMSSAYDALGECLKTRLKLKHPRFTAGIIFFAFTAATVWILDSPGLHAYFANRYLDESDDFFLTSEIAAYPLAHTGRVTNNPKLLFKVGQRYEMLGAYRDARFFYEQAIKQGNTPAAYNMACLTGEGLFTNEPVIKDHVQCAYFIFADRREIGGLPPATQKHVAAEAGKCREKLAKNENTVALLKQASSADGAEVVEMCRGMLSEKLNYNITSTY